MMFVSITGAESTAQTCYNQQYFHQLPAHYLQTLVTGLIWNQQQVEREGGSRQK